MQWNILLALLNKGHVQTEIGSDFRGGIIEHGRGRMCLVSTLVLIFQSSVDPSFGRSLELSQDLAVEK